MPFTFPSGPTITVQVAFSSTPFATSPSWTDITQYVRSVKIHRGRSRELDAFSAGTCSVLLSNADRRFDPEHATGPYVAGLLPMKKIQIVSNYSGTTSYLFTGYVDGWPQAYIEQNDSVVNVSATDGMKVLEQVELPGSLYEFVVALDKPAHWWKLNEPSGTTLPAYDSGFGVSYNGVYSGGPTLGASAIVGYDGSSTCASFTGGQYVSTPPLPESVLYWSVEGWFKTSEASGYLISVGGQTLDLGLAGVIRNSGALLTPLSYNDSIRHHFVLTSDGTNGRIYVDGSQVASATGSLSFTSGRSVFIAGSGVPPSPDVTATFVGSLSHVALYEETVLSATQVSTHYSAGASSIPEGTGTRIGRVLDFAGFPTSDRSIDTGSTTLAAYDLSGQSALSYINLLSQSESGGFYFLGNGNANFRSRGALITESAYTTSSATFSDAAGGITYNDFTTQYDDQDIRNEARVTRSGGVTQFASNTESQGTYGRRTYSLSGLLQENDIEAQARAQFVVQKYKDPEFRVRTLTIKPHAAPTQTWPQVLQRELEDRISVVRTPQNTGSAISKQVLIQSIDHSFGADLDWTTTYELAPANIETDFLIYDDPVRGFYDSGYSYIY